MTPENQAGDDRQAGPGPESERQSFHTRLLSRPGPSKPHPRRARPFPISLDRWGSIGRGLGQGALFIGGLAIGGAVILIRRGEAMRSRPALMIGIGVACVLFAILTHSLGRESATGPTSPDRG